MNIYKRINACGLLMVFFMSCLSLMAAVENPASWFRDGVISPDGKLIVFSYKGDIYTIPSIGGAATRLTTNPAYDGFPCWSSDGERIAFSSDRFGGLDVFVMPKQGGTPQRLTTNSANEQVQVFLDNEHILYTAFYMPTMNDIFFPGNFSQIYSVDVQGKRPVLFSAMAMEDISINKEGQILFHNNKGFEDNWRKHHQSPITRDLFLTQAKTENRTFKQLTTDKVENRNAVWTENGKGYYFLSELDGTINVYKVNNVGDKPVQITHYKNYPVRYLSISNDGTICYSWDGNFYTMKSGEKPQKVNVEILTDETEEYNLPYMATGGVQNIAVSKDEKEVAFIVEGDLYTTVMDYSTTKRLTKTPEQEANPTMSPDGRNIVFAAERGGTWNIYMQTLVNKNDKNFTYATDVKETPIIEGKESYFLPKYSPDGKKIAFLANRTEIRVYDVKTKSVNVVLPGKYNFSYTDGDVNFEWSPDSRWILTTSIADGGWNNPDVVVVSVDGKKIVNLTNSGYSDSNPHWALGGKAVVWSSDRAGYRSHGSWGSERDGYLMFLDREAWKLSNLNKEDRALYEERQKADVDTTAKTNDKKAVRSNKKKDDKSAENNKIDDKNVKSEKADSVKTLKLDFEGCEERVKRLTVNSTRMGYSYLAPDGKKFYYVAAYEGGYDLWVHNLEDGSTRILVKNLGGSGFIPDAKGENLYIYGGSIRKLTLANGGIKNIDISAECDGESVAEREYIYEHCVNQLRERFCDVNYHGVDFMALAEHYRHFLPNINNKRDLSEMVSELLGELNNSHTGLKYSSSNNSPKTAQLGAFFDEEYKGDGLKIQEILTNGPLDLPDRKIKLGYIVKEIDHQKIEKEKDYFPLLSGKSGRWVLLTIEDEKGKSFEVHVKPTTSASVVELLYNRWVKRCEKFTQEYSKGQVAYVHVRKMDSQSFRDTYSKILGKYRNCKALIVDDRHNGGGWLHEDLGVLLSGEEFQTFSSRGQYLGIDPFNRWTKPSCVLMCEDCYSNAHGFPFMYKTMKLGKLVGTPMAGTMTAVWWESIDRNLKCGIPEILCIDKNGNPVENQQLDPDVYVENTPEQMLNGEDAQLKRAIDLMLESIK